MTQYRIDKGFSEDRAMEELALSDLRGDIEVERIILNIQDQRRFFSQQEGNIKGDEIFKKDPGKVLRRLRNGLGSQGALDLAASAAAASSKGAGGSSDEGKATSGGHIRSAMGQITQAISDRGGHLYDTATIVAVNSGSPPPDTLNINLEDIPRPIHDAITLTHATTTEFLHHFWLAFLSGDEKRAADLQTLVGSLRRSGDRVEAVAKQAEEEREKEKERRKQAALAEYKATGRKRRKGDIPGGRKLVEGVLGPTMKAVEFAVGKWEEAVREAERAQGGAGSGGPLL